MFVKGGFIPIGQSKIIYEIHISSTINRKNNFLQPSRDLKLDQIWLYVA